MIDLAELKELTGREFDTARETATERIKSRIGDKPTRAAFKRDYAPLWTSLDYLAALVFVAALAISSMHILAYTGGQANISYTTAAKDLLGLQIDAGLYGVVHQIGFILLAEAAMLLFFVMFRTRPTWDRYVSLLLALAAMSFVIVANLASGLNVFLSILAPAFTVGVGFRLEALIAESYRRNQEIDDKYRAALEVYEKATADPAKHPDYQAVMASEIWQAIVKKNARGKSGADVSDAPTSYKRAAVRREIEKDRWAYGLDLEAAPVSMAGHQHAGAAVVEDNPLVMAAPATMIHTNGNGNGHHS